MIEHLVFFKTRSGTSEADKRKVIDGFRAFQGKMPGLREVACGENITDETQFAKGNNIGMRMLFDTQDDLRRYIEHPDHQEFAGWLVPMMEDITVCDFERE